MSLVNLALPAQTPLPPTGSPFIRNYSPDEYGAHNQNWAVAQDRRGVIYVGNNHGILEYDGVSWQLIPTPENLVVRSMAVGDDGRIYAGGFGQIGYLGPDADQRLQFVSLLPRVEERYRDFADVWQTLSVDGNIYFVTQKYIFRWDGRDLRVWEARTAFHVGFAVDGQFYVRQREVGLMQLVSDSLTLMPLGERLADERVMAMLPFDTLGARQRFLLATRTNGLLLYDGLTLESFPTQADALLTEGQLYCGTRLSDGRYAFGTLRQGVVIIDASGRLRQHSHKASGLQDETIWYLFQDGRGGLWAGMHFGISRLEITSPHTFFSEREGMEGSVLDIVRHRGRLYLATSMGIYYLEESPGAPRSFRHVTGVSPQAWALLPFERTLLAGVFDGVYEISEGRGVLIDSAYAMSLHRSRQDTNRVFVGMQTGLKSLYHEKGQWRDEGMIEGIDEEIRSFFELPDGRLWLTAYHKGLLLLDFSRGFTRRPPIRRFDTAHGLPGNSRTVVFSTPQGPRFATPRGVFRFDEQQGLFFPDTALIKGLPGEKAELFSVSEAPGGTLWMVGSEKAPSGLAVRQPDGAYRWEEGPFLRLSGLNCYYAYADPQREKATWLGCVDRVVLYNGAPTPPRRPPLYTLIRQVIANGDSLLYGGAPSGQGDPPRISHAYNSLRFRYAAPSFDDAAKTQYQYLLEGYDKDWSNWSRETYKDYTRLPAGNYRFLVRAKDLHQQLGETAAFSFRILPPFYLSAWAYLLYAILLTGLLVFLRRYEMKRIRKRHQREMTQLEYDKLKELDQLKSRFFANISHEFRTPLTLILGPVDQLLQARPAGEQARQYQLIKRNAQRLLQLINQLLDLARLEGRQMQMETAWADLVPLARRVTNSFQSLASQKNIELRLSADPTSIYLWFDADKIEKILTNLLSNAFRFTPDGGLVHVKLSELSTTDGGGHWLSMQVRDSGKGIAEADLPHIFDRFYQAGHAHQTGSGIGLALTKELVELHQGRIDVSSRLEEGSIFTILLPVGQAPESAKVEVTELPDSDYSELAAAAAASTETPSTAPATAQDADIVLLVEDDVDMRSYLYEQLNRRYRVLEAEDGRAGIELALEYVPDLVVSDVMMPGMDGYEFCRRLKSDERTSHIPVILLTAASSRDNKLAGLELGADDYLTKPFDSEELSVRVNNLITQRRRLRERYSRDLLQAEKPPTEPSREDLFLQKLVAAVEEHIAEEALDAQLLGRAVAMSRAQLYRKLQALTGQSVGEFILTIRLRRAAELLLQSDQAVSEIAFGTGFGDPSYFSRCFRQEFGVTPSGYRRGGDE